MSTVPPPASPEALMRVPLPEWRRARPSTLTVPPVAPAAVPETSSVPLLATMPWLPPSRMMVPLRSTSEVARMMPVLLTTVSRSVSALRARSRTLAAFGPDLALVQHPGT
jgi:hypothetical protein